MCSFVVRFYSIIWFTRLIFCLDINFKTIVLKPFKKNDYQPLKLLNKYLS